MYTPSPVELGAPPRYTEWRDGQDQLFWDILDSKKRISIHAAPVGVGKSLAYITAALVEGKRVCVLTESRGLQDQLVADFGSVGLFDMRGLQNYNCKALEAGGELEKMWIKKWGKPTCDVGPCTTGTPCQLRDSGCDYFDAYRKACGSELVVTNMAYWIFINKYGQGLGHFDVLVIDECHSAEGVLSSALSVEWVEKDFKELGSKPPAVTDSIQLWRMWARVQANKVGMQMEEITQAVRSRQVVNPDGSLVLIHDDDLPDAAELKFWKKLEGKCSTAAECSDDWVVERDETTGNIRLAPAWVRAYAGSHLFLDIKRVVMLSATVRPKIASLLGIPDGTWEFYEYPSTFPVDRRPIYWIPTTRLNSRSTDNDLRTLAVRIDQFIARRLDRKGIIHTVSYKLQQFLMTHSRFRHLMFANVPGNTREIVKAFRKAKAPAILVSPSVGTGFDFPFDTARYNIIAKLPFRDPRGAIMKAQSKDDADYLNYLTAQDLIQLYGRTNRDPKDFSETAIFDDNIEWFIKKTHLFPEYFTEAFVPVTSIPDPPTLEEIAC